MAERRTLLAVVAAAIVSVVVIGVILAFGIRHLPSFPPVSADPAVEPPGTIAFLTPDMEEPCIEVVPAAGGEPRTLHCTGADSELLWIVAIAWSPDGEVLAAGSSDLGDEVLLVIDPSTGEIVDRVVHQPDARPEPLVDPGMGRTRADGAQLLTGVDDDATRVVVRDPQGGRRTLVSVEGPRDYRFTHAQWSPDGEWVVVLDSEGRLLVLGAEGDPGPRLLVDGAEVRGGTVAWYIPGDETYTADPADLAGRS